MRYGVRRQITEEKRRRATVLVGAETDRHRGCGERADGRKRYGSVPTLSLSLFPAALRTIHGYIRATYTHTHTHIRGGKDDGRLAECA